MVATLPSPAPQKDTHRTGGRPSRVPVEYHGIALLLDLS